LCHSAIDNAAVRAGLQVNGRQLQRTLRYDEGPLSAGVVNMILSEDEAGRGSVVFNFHRSTNDSVAIREWLGLAPDVVRGSVTELLQECLGIEEGVA
jgi:hypothetical protein